METSFYLDLDYNDASNNDTFHALLDKYFDKYVCGKELSKSNVKHYQVWCYNESDDNAYDNFIAKAKKRWSLQGRATKDHRKEYGKIRGIIKDTDNMISYCVKDHNYTYKGLDPDYMKEREDLSYQKEDSEVDKYQQFLTLAKKETTRHPDTFDPSPQEKYYHRLKNCTILSSLWYKIYDKVIPKTSVDKVLLQLDLITHEDIAHDRFRSYLGAPPQF